MKIYAISDLHLSFSSNKPMDVFGREWKNHDARIRENWLQCVSVNDIVVIPGDISWGLRKDSTEEDFRWIHDLPGTKVLFKGNHDFWWTTSKKLNALYDDMFFIQNTYYAAGDIAICGTRGWDIPESCAEWSAHDEKIYQRELGRLRLSLESAKRDGRKRIIAAVHYPPVERRHRRTGFTEILEEFGVEKVIFGHLHGQTAHRNAFTGISRGIEYRLVSCDYLHFRPVCIAETETTGETEHE